MNPIDELEHFFAEIVAQMENEFDSHDFILVLAHEYQSLYVQALAQYADSDAPFQTVHMQLAKRLALHLDLVKSDGKRNSKNIFGRISAAEVWHKV